VRHTTIQLYRSVPLTCIQPVQLPYNQSVPEMNMYQQKYNRYVTCSVEACVCTRPICYATHICMRPNCYATCVCLLKTRVYFLSKNSDPLLLLSHRYVTCQCIQTVTVPCACILIHNLYPKHIYLSLVMCHIGVCNNEQV
jgi:hypothetical protein